MSWASSVGAGTERPRREDGSLVMGRARRSDPQDGDLALVGARGIVGYADARGEGCSR